MYFTNHATDYISILILFFTSVEDKLVNVFDPKCQHKWSFPVNDIVV